MIRALRLLAICLMAFVTPAAAAAPVLPGQSAEQAQATPPNHNYIFDLDVSTLEALPRNLADEAKFANEDPKLIDQIEFINQYVNDNIVGVDDSDQYGVDDFWVQAPVSKAGDCEDYAITKLYMLEKLELNIVTDSQLVFVEVHFLDDKGKPTEEGHAILAVHLPHGTVLFLDNMNERLMTKSELIAQGYEFHTWNA